jgi:ubiquinone/menaquinone biosynthesis C-methylase UbiE
MSEEPKYYEYPQQLVDVSDFHAEGLILDVGGGGEGVIGRLFGPRVLAIDLRRDELAETPPGPLKIVMDARELQFLDGSFDNATAFFSFMYLSSRADHLRVLQEVRRVLRPGGQLHLWEVSLWPRPHTALPCYVVNLRVRLPEGEITPGYGQRWPSDARDEAYYRSIAAEAGFTTMASQKTAHTFYLRLGRG